MAESPEKCQHNHVLLVKRIIEQLPEMGEELLDKFDDEIDICQTSMKNAIDNLPKEFEFKVVGIPNSEKLSIGEIRGIHKNKLIKVLNLG